MASVETGTIFHFSTLDEVESKAAAAITAETVQQKGLKPTNIEEITKLFNVVFLEGQGIKKGSSMPCRSFEEAAQMILNIGDSFDEDVCSTWKNSKAWLPHAVGISDSSFVATLPLESQSKLNHLIGKAWELNKNYPKAFTYHKRALHLRFFSVISTKGQDLFDGLRYGINPAALKSQEELTTYTPIEQICDFKIASSLKDVGFTFLKTGNFLEAIRFFEASIEMGMKSQHEDALLEKAILLNYIGVAYYSLEILDMAKGCFTKSVELLTEYSNVPSNPFVFIERQRSRKGSKNGLAALINLGFILMKRENYQDAYHICINAEAQFYKLLKSRDHLLLYSIQRLKACCLRGVNNSKAALVEEQEALRIMSTLYGEEDIKEKAAYASFTDLHPSSNNVHDLALK